MTTNGSSAVVIEVGFELLKRVVPSGLAWVTTWIRGKKIMIVGQPRSGKTSFLRYLRFGIYADPSEHTPRTRRITKTASFTLGMGKNEALKFEVRNVIDTVGQVAGEEHARNVAKYNPHELIVVLDLTSEWRGTNEYSAGFYLEEFCDYLAERIDRSKSLKSNLKSITVIINKKDKDKAKRSNRWKVMIRIMVKDKLRHSFGAKAKDIPILACSLVEKYDKGKLANNAITKIALALVK